MCLSASIFYLQVPCLSSRNTEGSSYGLCMCLHGIYCMTREEAQAAISQQPLFAPQNEALQDNEHFKTATPTTPTTRLSQHSDIGRERAGERGRGRESAGSVKATLSVFSREQNSAHLQRRLRNNPDYTTHITLFPLLSVHLN